jgi:hypothetical protein
MTLPPTGNERERVRWGAPNRSLATALRSSFPQAAQYGGQITGAGPAGLWHTPPVATKFAPDVVVASHAAL